MKTSIPHDEAFKKLLYTFFAEFIALFFPELDKQLDHRHTRFLMQEQLVDIIGEERRTLDLLLETRYKATDTYILIHLEPQSYRQDDFHERMFIYFSRLFERHRKEHQLIIPIAVFTEPFLIHETNTLTMSIPGHSILNFQFLKVEICNHNWRDFIDSNNPVAAALLAKMGYNKGEEREIRFSFLRMMLGLRKRLDDARIALIMSIADLYFQPDRQQDESILLEIAQQFPEEGEHIMELMPAWKRWGYEEGLEEGIEKGIEKGMETARLKVAQKLLEKGFSLEEIGETIELPVEEVQKLVK
ncbi:Rpn family recombination-promoting nuclease/putative transposase [Paenibacillus sp. alder61]|uniref:Rpn family recombination-promoting nuclease/putative transposase n=1 Tax=Paenibacillus sp. alder61 TaxID=2862948 RepID=UPI001CD2AC0E|nr:Rpn family recombination-promoting nuclease/putative transposase [Paenibacillus sp. alder61]MCA1296094.1 Rpn family recombination-promoting nuclease/putative transposase [Paenibacillus sp. alder61]